jgi:hypothetical protein
MRFMTGMSTSRTAPYAGSSPWKKGVKRRVATW